MSSSLSNTSWESAGLNNRLTAVKGLALVGTAINIGFVSILFYTPKSTSGAICLAEQHWFHASMFLQDKLAAQYRKLGCIGLLFSLSFAPFLFFEIFPYRNGLETCFTCPSSTFAFLTLLAFINIWFFVIGLSSMVFCKRSVFSRPKCFFWILFGVFVPQWLVCSSIFASRLLSIIFIILSNCFYFWDGLFFFFYLGKRRQRLSSIEL